MKHTGFLVNTNTSWEEPPRCRHQVANELSKTFATYFVEKNKVGYPRVVYQHEQGNLYRITPYWPIDNRIVTRLPVFNELYQEFLFSALRKMFRAENIEISHIINFSYNSNRLFSHFHDQIIVYYCNDDFLYVGRFTPFFVRVYIRHIENQVIRRSHCCIGTSDYLVSKLKKHNSNSYRILLGADNAISDRYQIFTSTDKNRRPIRVVYVGFMIRNSFDIKWIEDYMDSQEFFFSFVGPLDEATRLRFKRYSNAVEFVGQQTGDALYNILSTADVCIAPYVKSSMLSADNGTTPNKLWLYLEAGKPVVLSQFPLPNNFCFEPSMIYMVDDNHKMPDTIRSAYLEDNESLFKGRIQMAKNNSWENRISQLMDYLRSQGNGSAISQDD